MKWRVIACTSFPAGGPTVSATTPTSNNSTRYHQEKELPYFHRSKTHPPLPTSSGDSNDTKPLPLTRPRIENPKTPESILRKKIIRLHLPHPMAKDHQPPNFAPKATSAISSRLSPAAQPVTSQDATAKSKYNSTAIPNLPTASAGSRKSVPAPT